MGCGCSEGEGTGRSEGTGGAAELVRAIQRLLESGASEEDVSALMEAMGGHGDLPPADGDGGVGGGGASGPSTPAWLEPFQTLGDGLLDWAPEDPEAGGEDELAGMLFDVLAGRALLGEAALRRLATRLGGLGAGCDAPGRADAADDLSEAFGSFADGWGGLAGLLEGREGPGDDLVEVAEALNGGFHAVLTALDHAAETREADDPVHPLRTLGQHLARTGPVLWGFTSSLSVPTELGLLPVASSAVHLGQAYRGLVESLGLILLAGVVLPPVRGRRGCTTRCPHKGCTDWCRERYTPTACTPWRRIVGGVGGPTGLYHRVCTWLVRQSEVSYCACYRSRWDRFWATGACSTWTERGGPRWIAKNTQEWAAAGLTPPGAALPAPFTATNIGNC